MQPKFHSKPENRTVLLLKVRTNLRGGASMEACEDNVNYWKKEYNKWYDAAIAAGRYPPTPRA
jgi:hypothetical protein